MSKMLTGFINLTACKEAKLFENKKKEKCANIIVWINDTPDQYGNIASIQLQGEKDAPKVYVGNLKPYEKKQAQSQTQAPQQGEDDLPF